MTQLPELDDSFLDEPFHGAAWAAFAELYRETGGMPDSEETRLRAYRIYEEELARKNAAKAGSESCGQEGPDSEAKAGPEGHGKAGPEDRP